MAADVGDLPNHRAFALVADDRTPPPTTAGIGHNFGFHGFVVIFSSSVGSGWSQSLRLRSRRSLIRSSPFLPEFVARLIVPSADCSLRANNQSAGAPRPQHLGAAFFGVWVRHPSSFHLAKQAGAGHRQGLFDTNACRAIAGLPFRQRPRPPPSWVRKFQPFQRSAGQHQPSGPVRPST